MFMQGDFVRYVGRKFNLKTGEIVAKIQNQEGVFVVEFGDDSYVMPESSLAKWTPTPAQLETQVMKRRRRDPDEE